MVEFVFKLGAAMMVAGFGLAFLAWLFSAIANVFSWGVR